MVNPNGLLNNVSSTDKGKAKYTYKSVRDLEELVTLNVLHHQNCQHIWYFQIVPSLFSQYGSFICKHTLNCWTYMFVLVTLDALLSSAFDASLQRKQ